MKNIILVSLLLFTSCKTSKNISKNEIKKDSLVYVDKVKIDSIFIKEKIEIEKPTTNEVNLKCDSTSFNQSFKNSVLNYSIIKDKEKIRFIIKTDTITRFVKDSYVSKMNNKDSLQKVASKIEKIEISNQKPSFVQTLFSNFWKVAFWIIFVLYILLLLGFNPLKFIIKLIKP
jgi:hypothetical protein